MGIIDFKSRNVVHIMEYKPSDWLGRLESQDVILLLKTALVPGDRALGLAKASGSSAFVATWQHMCCFCSFPSSSSLFIPPPPSFSGLFQKEMKCLNFLEATVIAHPLPVSGQLVHAC